MNTLREAFDWLSQFPEDLQLDMIIKVAEEKGMEKLFTAIFNYWESQEEILTREDYIGAQEQSIKEQFGND